MTTRKRMFVSAICTFALLANVIGVVAQERVVKTESKFVTVDVPPGQMATGGYVQGDNTFVFVSSEMSIDGKLVKGAPYSAQAINESVQTLAGGNRIVRQDTSSVYRDSEGRTRRDQTISVVGGYSAAGGPAQTTFINDPVAGVNYILDAKNRTARKIDVSAKMAMEKRMFETMKDKRSAEGATPADEKAAVIAELKAKRAADAGDEKAVAEKIAAVKQAADTADGREFRFEMRAGPPPGPRMAGNGPAGFTVMMGNKKNTRKEDLGKQTIEGVEAEGTRYVTTIPAGEIGNEQPIEMVFETWFSPELQTVVMSKHSDPRSGENTYRLTNINRTEPPHSLFEVPADYTVQEGGTVPDMRYKIERDGVRRPGGN